MTVEEMGKGRSYINSEPWFICQNLLLLLGCFVELQLVANNCLLLFLLLLRVSDIFGLFLRRMISEQWLNICGQMTMFLWLACGAVQWVLLLGNLTSLLFCWSCCIMCTALLLDSMQQGCYRLQQVNHQRVIGVPMAGNDVPLFFCFIEWTTYRKMLPLFIRLWQNIVLRM